MPDDNKSIVEPLILDGSTICPRQTLEGSQRPWYQDVLDYYAPLTRDEADDYLEILWRIEGRNIREREITEEEHLRFDAYNVRRLAHLERLHASRPRKAHAGHELGAREFTLTYSPKMMDDAAARAGMIVAIDKLCRYYSDEIVELRAVGEVGSNGLSHVHCFYKLRGGVKITDKNFKRAWNPWNPKKKLGRGFEGGHHATVREESDFRGYIDKDVAVAWFEKNVKN